MDQAEFFLTLDRIETDEGGHSLGVLVSDDGLQQLILPLDRLPVGSREGTVFRVDLQPSPEETERRRQQIRDMQARLFETREKAETDQESH